MYFAVCRFPLVNFASADPFPLRIAIGLRPRDAAAEADRTLKRGTRLKGAVFRLRIVKNAQKN